MTARPRTMAPLLLALFSAVIGCKAESPLSAYTCTSTTPEGAADHPKAPIYQQLLDDAVADGIPGVVAWVRDVRDGEEANWAGEAGYGNLDDNVPIQSCHRFRIGDLTKTFVATVVMQLVAEDLVNLDTPISNYVRPEDILDIENANVATVKQVLGHTSGIVDYEYTRCFIARVNDGRKVYGFEEALDCMRGEPAYFAPGTDYEYSNGNYVLLGKLIESVEERDVADVIGYRVFRLPLNDSFLYLDGYAPEGLVDGYADVYGNGMLADYTDYAFGHSLPDQGIISTVGDLMIFANNLFQGGLVTSESLDIMTRESKRGSRYGLGLQLGKDPAGRLIWYHYGSLWGYQASMVYYPAYETYFVVLANGSHGLVEERFKKLTEGEFPAAIFQ